MSMSTTVVNMKKIYLATSDNEQAVVIADDDTEMQSQLGSTWSGSIGVEILGHAREGVPSEVISRVSLAPLSEVRERINNREWAGELLVKKMRDISEMQYAASWLVGLEFALWRLVAKGGGRENFYGFTMTSEVAANLSDLAEGAGGWPIWDDASSNPQIMPMAEWKSRFARWEEERKA
jgi:hypothetical protein